MINSLKVLLLTISIVCGMHPRARTTLDRPSCVCSEKVSAIMHDINGAYCLYYGPSGNKRWKCENTEEWNRYLETTRIIVEEPTCQCSGIVTVNNVNYLKTKENVQQKLVALNNSIFPVFDFPLKDYENLLQLERYLENEKQTNDTIQGLSRIGGLNGQESGKTSNVNGDTKSIVHDSLGTWCGILKAGEFIKRWPCENEEEWNDFYAKYPDYKPKL
ncbi:hypothetical protein FQA39_LY17089 [Lamprigera yunnana]|nr:hypothetical protein FQA39_LY17089 [Lamprigera yunnana]